MRVRDSSCSIASTPTQKKSIVDMWGESSRVGEHFGRKGSSSCKKYPFSERCHTLVTQREFHHFTLYCLGDERMTGSWLSLLTTISLSLSHILLSLLQVQYTTDQMSYRLGMATRETKTFSFPYAPILYVAIFRHHTPAHTRTGTICHYKLMP